MIRGKTGLKPRVRTQDSEVCSFPDREDQPYELAGKLLEPQTALSWRKFECLPACDAANFNHALFHHRERNFNRTNYRIGHWRTVTAHDHLDIIATPLAQRAQRHAARTPRKSLRDVSIGPAVEWAFLKMDRTQLSGSG
jgi:hypothetical protein